MTSLSSWPVALKSVRCNFGVLGHAWSRAAGFKEQLVRLRAARHWLLPCVKHSVHESSSFKLVWNLPLQLICAGAKTDECWC